MRRRGLLFFFGFAWLVFEWLGARQRSEEIKYYERVSPAYAAMLLEGRRPLYEELLTVAAVPAAGIGGVLFVFDLKEWWRKRKDGGIG